MIRVHIKIWTALESFGQRGYPFQVSGGDAVFPHYYNCLIILVEVILVQCKALDHHLGPEPTGSLWQDMGKASRLLCVMT